MKKMICVSAWNTDFIGGIKLISDRPGKSLGADPHT